MFKLGAFTDEISQDLAYACRVCKDFGVTGAEIRNVWDTNVSKLTETQVRDVKSILADHGMVACSIGSPFGKCELDNPEETAEHMDMLRRLCDLAHELDAPFVRGFAFWGHGARQKPWDRMLAAFEPVPGILEEKRGILALENEAACYVGTAGHLRTFLDGLQCDRIKAVWDPANHVQDPDGDGTPPYPDGYELIRGGVVHVHVKDALVEPDGTRPNVFLGMGSVDWHAQFAALAQDGYDGYVSLETHVNPARFPEQLAARYAQYLTGEDGEAASKVCLAWMRDAMPISA
jgi:sugar phosphate isomerase/epimerase